MLLFEKDKNICKKRLTKPSLSDKIHHVPNGTYALVAQLDRVTDYESVGRGFESLPSHQESPTHFRVPGILFVRSGGFEQQRRRPQPAAETGRSCWGRVLIFQSPAKGLQKNQQTQPVRPCTAGQAISPAGCCLARGSQHVGTSNKRTTVHPGKNRTVLKPVKHIRVLVFLFSVRREDSSYPFLFFIQMRYSPSVMRVSRYRMGVQHASRMGMGRLPVA